MVTGERRFDRFLRAILLAAWLGGSATGCALVKPMAETASNTTGLTWLTTLVTQPIETAGSPFDMAQLKTADIPAVVDVDDLLEITVWDLEEPGQPRTFPARVQADRSIVVPLLNEVSVAGLDLAAIERLLIDEYRREELLVEPRIVVRSLESPQIQVDVLGSVVRPGHVEIPRKTRTVYAAILGAGGLNRSGPMQVTIAHNGQPGTTAGASEPALNSTANSTAVSDSSRAAAPNGSVGSTARMTQRSNTIADVSVPALEVSAEKPAAASGETSGASPAIVQTTARPVATQRGLAPEQPTTFDLSSEAGVRALRDIRLLAGDTITVKNVTPPLRIQGIVARPGPYELPTGRVLNVWQALDLAGGVAAVGTPLRVTLLRPAGEGRPAQRWYVSLAKIEQHPESAPLVQAGDILSVETTATTRIKKAVGDLWR